MTTELPEHMDNPNDLGPLALVSSEGLGAGAGARKPAGAFFSAAMLKNATMSELAEARARRGYCPKCQAQSLRHCYSGGGMVFRQCAECGTVAVLGA
jgi:hypothetical protein